MTKSKHWQAAVGAWQNSGLTVAAFCERERISKSLFYRKKLEILGGAPNPKKINKSPPKFIAISPDELAATQNVQVLQQHIRISTRSGIVIEVPL